MNARNACKIVLMLAFSLLSGCSSTRYNVTVVGQTGNTIDSRTVETEDLESTLDEMYSLLAQGQYEKCRALGSVVEELWTAENEALSESRRLSAWATLFLYKQTPVRMTSLENEMRNLLILRAATLEFLEVCDPWMGEAELALIAIDARLVDRQAFNSFVKHMRSSVYVSIIDGVQGSRSAAVATVLQTYPEWSQCVGLGQLAEFPWRAVKE